MITPDLVADLMALGIVGDQLTGALRAFQKASPVTPDVPRTDPVTERRRAYDRERKRRARARAKERTEEDTEAQKVSQGSSPNKRKVPKEKNTLPPNPSKRGVVARAREDGPTIEETVVENWNRLARDLRLPKCLSLTPKREQAIALRVRDAGGLANLLADMDRIRDSPGLQGKAGGTWRADIDWFLRPGSFLKLREGKYDNWKRPKSEFMEAVDNIRERLAANGHSRRDDGGGGAWPLGSDQADPDS
jgi:hypothetical protein